MMNVLKVNKSQLKKQIGQVYSGVRDYTYRNLVTGFIGELPVLIETDLSQEQFNLFCQGLLPDSVLEQI